jgi:WD40 repeat protein
VSRNIGLCAWLVVSGVVGFHQKANSQDKAPHSGLRQVGDTPLAVLKVRSTPGGSRSSVTRLLYSPSGKHIAAATAARHVRLWNADDGREIGDIEFAAYNSLTFSDDSWLLGAVDHYGSYRLLESDTGEKLLSRSIDKQQWRAECSDFSPRMDLIAHGMRDGAIRLVDVATGVEVRKIVAYGQRTEVHAVAFSPDGRVLASVAEQDPRDQRGRTIELWDVQSGARLRKLEIPDSGGRAYSFRPGSLQFSSDGALLSVSQHLGAAYLWRVATGQCIVHLAEQRGPAAFSSDGRMRVVVDDVTLQLIENTTDEVLVKRSISKPDAAAVRRSLRAAFNIVALSPDNRRCAAARADDNSVIVWSLAPNGWRDRARRDKLDDKQFQRLWTRLALHDGPAGYEAMWRLAAHGDPAVKKLADHLRAVRKPASEEERIAALIKNLDSDEFQVRTDAGDGLASMGESVRKPLRKALKAGVSLEASMRISAILERLENSSRQFSGEPLRRMRAIQVLEYIATDDAARLLEQLAAGAPEAQLTNDAQSALKRVRSRIQQR